MAQNAQKPVFGTLFPSTFLLAHHFLSGGVHPASAQECAALAATHLGGLAGKTTIHPGAGFGADIWAAHMYGVAEAIGLEISVEQKMMGDLIARSTDEVGKKIEACPVVNALYVDIESGSGQRKSQLAIATDICNQLDDQISSIKWLQGSLGDDDPAPINIHLCDISKPVQIEQALGRTQGNAVIANFLLHILVNDTRPTVVALELLAPLARQQGVVVVSLPSQAVERAHPRLDGQIRLRSVFNHSKFQLYSYQLQKKLREKFGPNAVNPVRYFEKPWRRITDTDLSKGSPSLIPISSHIRGYMAPYDTERDVIAGLLLFEAVFSTGRPAAELVYLVRSVLLEQPYQADYGLGIYVHYHVYRRR